MLQYLVYELSERILEIYKKLFSSKEYSKNKEGLIQLLFDVRFLFDILSGRKSIGDSLKNEYFGTLMKHDNNFDLDDTEQTVPWSSIVNQMIEQIEHEVSTFVLL